MRITTLITTVLLTLLVFQAEAHAESIFQEPKGGAEFSQFPFWKQILTDMAAANAPAIIPAAAGDGAQRGAACADDRHCAPAAWTAFLDSLSQMTPREQMQAVNQWANARPYVEDIVNWGVADYWETPGQFLARGGDCEDYAVFKYFSLIRLGFSPDDLRIVVVDDAKLKAFHAVLAVRAGGETWLLDSQIAEIETLAAAVQYAPIYSLNEHGWWMHATPKISLGTVTIVAARAPGH
jgi:predicted transglutaminase-like cysteine proteinase